MRNKFMDPKKQFSKWLAKSGAIYWIIFHTILLAVMCFRPEVAIACVYMSIIVSVVMIIHIISYTQNSTLEKLLLTIADKTNINLSLKGISTSSIAKQLKDKLQQSASETEEDSNEDEDIEEEDVDNG